jgi:hypothetical protein
MKLKPAVDNFLRILIVLLALVTLLLVFLSRSFFLDENSVYGKF